MKKPLRLKRDESVLVVVDMQEKLFPLMQQSDALLRRVRMLMRGAKLLGIPVILTEQYVKGLGRSIPQVLELADGATIIEKSCFSTFGSESFRRALIATERRQVLVCGIEAHICVLQTCFDALDEGYETFVASDAVSSRLEHTAPAGLARLSSSGVVSTVAEGTLFEWLTTRESPEFKRVLEIVKSEGME